MQLPQRLRVARRVTTSTVGASTAEFAIIFPFFFLLLFGVFEFSRAWFAANSLQFAVAQSARYAMTSPVGGSKPTGSNCSTWSPATYQTAIQTYLQTQLNAWYLSSAIPTVTASVNCAAAPATLTVTVRANYTFSTWSTRLTSIFSGLAMRQQATVTTPLS